MNPFLDTSERELAKHPGAIRGRTRTKPPRDKGKFLPFTPNKTVDRVVQFVAEEFGLEPAQLYGKDRRGSVSAARHLACAAVRMGTKLSLNEIGAAFGNRNHTTIMSAIKGGRRLAEKDERLGDILDRATKLLGLVQRDRVDQHILRQQYARLAAIDDEIATLQRRRAQVERAIEEERMALGLGVVKAEPVGQAERLVAAG